MNYFEWAVSSDQKKLVVSYHNLHSVHLIRRVPEMKRFYSMTDLTYIDGMPLIFWGMLLGHPVRPKNRTSFLDWNEEFFSMAEANGWRVFYLGGRQQTIEKGAEILRARNPRLSIQFHHGYLNDADLPGVYEEIREFKPNVLLVGMGMPLQEKWIVNAFEHVTFNVVVNGGAMIEYMTGDQLPAPRWLGPIGLEWAYRLITQPRLARRYLVQPFYMFDLFWNDVVNFFRRKLSA